MPVKNFFFALFLVLFCSSISLAQPNNEIVFGAGAGYYIGDLNPRRHLPLDFIKPAFGFSFRQNTNPRVSWNFGLNYIQVEANDALSDDPWRQNRNLSFQSDIIELSTRIEFNFLDFDLFKKDRTFSPYVFVGLGIFYFNPVGELNGNLYELQPLTTEGQVVPYNRTQLSIPFGTGVKFRVAKRVNAAVEWNMRKLFTDYLDDVSTVYPSDPSVLSTVALGLSNKAIEQNGLDGTNWGSQRGDSKSNDWFGVIGVTLSFRLTKNPHECYFNPMKIKY